MYAMDFEQEWQEFRARFRDVFMEALSHVASLPPSSYLPGHYEWPELSLSKNGMPSTTMQLLGGPTDYTQA